MKRSRCAVAAAVWLGALACGTAQATPADLLEQGRRLLQERAESTAAATGGRVEVRISDTAAERIARAPCEPEVFLPSGGLPTGRTSVGLRCADKPWQIRVPAEVALYAPVPVPTRALPAGAVLQAGDWITADVDLAAWPRGILTDPRQLEGATTTRPLRAGDPIAPNSVISRDRLGPGDPVQVVLTGDGFVVKAAGKMMNQASPGQAARVQLDSGRTVAGTLRDGREIEVRM